MPFSSLVMPREEFNKQNQKIKQKKFPFMDKFRGKDRKKEKKEIILEEDEDEDELLFEHPPSYKN